MARAPAAGVAGADLASFAAVGEHGNAEIGARRVDERREDAVREDEPVAARVARRGRIPAHRLVEQGRDEMHGADRDRRIADAGGGAGLERGRGERDRLRLDGRIDEAGRAAGGEVDGGSDDLRRGLAHRELRRGLKEPFDGRDGPERLSGTGPERVPQYWWADAFRQGLDRLRAREFGGSERICARNRPGSAGTRGIAHLRHFLCDTDRRT
jgi:hypothetical protein